MNNIYGQRCDPELAAPFNRRALTPSDLSQMVDDAAGFAGQAAASAEHAEEVVAGIDGEVTRAEGFADAAATAAGEADTSAGEATSAAGEAQGHAGTALAAQEAAEEAEAGAEQARVDALAVAASKGQPNGIGSLDSSGKQPEAQVPARLAAAALTRAFVSVRTSDGQQLPAGTVVLITLDKTLAQVTANPVADIADITFTTGA